MRTLLVILVIALAIRLLATLTAPTLMPVIEYEYDAIAEHLRNGDGYINDSGQPPIEYTLPGYAYFRSALPPVVTAFIDSTIGVLLIYGILRYAGHKPLKH